MIAEVQATISSSTSCSFTFPNLKSGKYDMHVYVTNLGWAGSFEIDIKLHIVSISPTQVSLGGSLITIETSGLNIEKDLTVNLIRTDNN